MIRALVIGILSAGVLAACSTTPSNPVSRTAAASPTGLCSRADGKVMQAGTGNCTSEVRSYSAKQLRQTGKLDAAHALQMLDPSVTIGP